MTSELAVSLEIGRQGISVLVLELVQGLPTLHVHQVPYLPSLGPRQATALTLRAILDAMDAVLEWLSGPVRGLKGQLFTQSPQSQEALATRVVLISVTAYPDAHVIVSKQLQSIICALDTTDWLSDQISDSSLNACARVLDEGNGADIERVEQIEDWLADRSGTIISDRIQPHLHSSVKCTSRLDFRKALASRLGRPLSPITLPMKLLQLDASVDPLSAQDSGSALLSSASSIMSLESFVTSLLVDRACRPSSTDATLSCLYNVEEQRWDDELVDAVVSNFVSFNISASDLKILLAEPNSSPMPCSCKVSRWLAKCFGFPSSCRVFTCPPSHLASYFSFLPAFGDVGLQLGRDDVMIVPTSTPVPDVERIVLANPLSSLGNTSGRSDSLAPQPNYLAICNARLAGQWRESVKEAYANGSWKVFERLLGAVSLGGSVGMDNKFFTIARAQKGLQRFESGIPIHEFSDLRANPSCLIEGQAQSMRSLLGRIMTKDLQQCREGGHSVPSKPCPSALDFASGFRGVGDALQFDPFDVKLTPFHILAWGQAAANKGIAERWTNVMGGAWTVYPVEAAKSNNRAKPSAQGMSHAWPTSLNISSGTGSAFSACRGAAYFAIAAIEARRSQECGCDFAGFHAVITSWLTHGRPCADTAEATAARQGGGQSSHGRARSLSSPNPSGVVHLSREISAFSRLSDDDTLFSASSSGSPPFASLLGGGGLISFTERAPSSLGSNVGRRISASSLQGASHSTALGMIHEGNEHDGASEKTPRASKIPLPFDGLDDDLWVTDRGPSTSSSLQPSLLESIRTSSGAGVGLHPPSPASSTTYRSRAASVGSQSAWSTSGSSTTGHSQSMSQQGFVLGLAVSQPQPRALDTSSIPMRSSSGNHSSHSGPSVVSDSRRRADTTVGTASTSASTGSTAVSWGTPLVGDFGEVSTDDPRAGGATEAANLAKQSEMRAWLQGQSAFISSFTSPGYLHPYHHPREEARLVQSDGPSIHATFPPLFFPGPLNAQDRARARSAAEEHLWSLLESEKSERHQLLGLETVCVADDDVWLVYGGLMEEYIRLRSRMGPLGQGVGEGLDGWM